MSLAPAIRFSGCKLTHSLPFRIRSKGLMVMQLCVNAALVLNQYANPIALDALDWKYYIV